MTLNEVNLLLHDILSQVVLLTFSSVVETPIEQISFNIPSDVHSYLFCDVVKRKR